MAHVPLSDAIVDDRDARDAVSTEVLIAGAGLTGLRIASLLAARDVPATLLEARERVGGRILSTSPDGVDLGPSWFWPGQHRIAALIDELGLVGRVFEQASAGLSVHEAADGAIVRQHGIASMRGSLRLAGGLATLTDALRTRLPPGAVLTGHRVLTVRRTDTGVAVRALTSAGPVEHHARQLVLALPPRLIAAGIAFEPALPDALLARLLAVPTWMAGQGKLAAVYADPFWTRVGLSGDALSRLGPLVEVHDASMPDGTVHALSGFIGVPFESRRRAGDEALEAAAVAQLARLFGAAAASPLAVHLKDWAADPLTASARDGSELPAHPDGRGLDAPWEEALLFAGTETASAAGHAAGYLEGALESAERVVQRPAHESRS